MFSLKRIRVCLGIIDEVLELKSFWVFIFIVDLYEDFVFFVFVFEFKEDGNYSRGSEREGGRRYKDREG